MSKKSLSLYGYQRAKNGQLLELREVTLCLDANQAERLGKFLLQCSQNMKNDEAWEHEHFTSGEVDLVVFNSGRVGNLTN
jgi:hypothetical protein